MIATIAIDTNIAIKFLKGDYTCTNIIRGKIPLLSFISEIELLSWPQLDLTGDKLIRSFLSECFIINLFPELKDKSIEIRKNYGLKVPDALIAATAITKKLTFFSGDDIFNRVKDLNFIHVQ